VGSQPFTGEREEGSPLPALVGMEVGCVREISQHVLDLAPCRGVVFLNREEAPYYTPLSSYPPAVMGKSGHSRSRYSDWVLQGVKEIHRVWGFCVRVLMSSLWLF
jgi:hypothetical protein